MALRPKPASAKAAAATSAKARQENLLATSLALKAATDGITVDTLGLDQVDNTSDANKPISTATQTALNGKEPSIAAGSAAQYWRGDKTFATLDKAAVGLANVDNTSDLGKPISTLTQTALNAKEATIAAGTAAQYWRGDKSWQTLDKTAVGLGNVDNTADTAKPVSTAQQTALNGKASLSTQVTIATNAAATVTPTASVYQVFHTGTLTADRLLTLTTAGMTSGFTIRFTRTGSGAFNLQVGALKNLITNSWCDVVFNGSAWVLTAYGTL